MSRYINSVPQILDGNGKPIVGAKKFFFTQDTVIKKTIYSDSALTIAAANPVISDADGRFPDTFLNGLYKEEQQDNSGTATGYDGVTLWTRDPVGEIAEGPFQAWDTSITYNIPDIVQGSDNEYYRSIVDSNTGSDPILALGNWEKLNIGRFWEASKTYALNENVYGSDGYLYTSRVAANLGADPTSNTTNWRPGVDLKFPKGADIASAAALALGDDGYFFDVTGTETITSILTKGIGSKVMLQFDGALTLTHNATSLILPGAANITTAAGDTAIFYEYSVGNWFCLNYTTATGLPVVQIIQSAIAASAVGQAELKTTTGEISTSVPTGADLVLPGGQYGYWPQIKESGGAAAVGYDYTGGAATWSMRSITTSYSTNVTLSSGSGIMTGYLQQRYIQASPPYDLGDGEIPRFIFVEINKSTGKIMNVYSAPEAPWHYNGPTDIRGTLINGKKYRKRKDMKNMPFTLAEAKTDIIKLQEYNAAFNSASIIYEEITQQIKNADMHLIPRPMTASKGSVVVMLDPVCDLMWQLNEMCLHEEFSINELLHEKFITINNSKLNRFGPESTDIVGFKMKKG